MLRARILAVISLSMLLAACGSSDAPVDPAATVTAATPNANADFTAAVAVGTVAAPARVQFRIGDRPAAGQPVQVAVRVGATADVDKLQVLFEPEAGLSFVDEKQSTFVLDGMKSGGTHAHELRLTPAQDGVYLLKVIVMTDTAGGSKASEYAIPVLVGPGPAPAAPAAPAATAAPAAPAQTPAPGG